MHPLVRLRGLQREVAALWVDGVRWNRELTQVTLKRRGKVDPFQFSLRMTVDLNRLAYEGAVFVPVSHGLADFSRKEKEPAAFATFEVRFPDGRTP